MMIPIGGASDPLHGPSSNHHTMKGSFTAFILSAALLTSCTSVPPPLAAVNPANPRAREGFHFARSVSLTADSTTTKTHELLSAAHDEQRRWDQNGPVSESPNEMIHSPTNAEPAHEHP